MVFDLPYLKRPERTGNLRGDVEALLAENGRPKTAAHCVMVAETCARLAERFRLNEATAYCSGILHDVSNAIKPEDMLRYAEGENWYIDEAEKAHNFLLHQRISAVAAREYFGVADAEVLSAIECHTTLRADPSQYDMTLFLADKISWDQEGIPPYIDIVQRALNDSLAAASLAYIDYVMSHNGILYPHAWLLQAIAWLDKRRAK